ncbi:branched-chain amino acid aminotransferase [Streptomyces sp. NPDC048106]|uniref:branched-chain amino acid aminotransferase n=1 Tax=Streptomyces sp. NPDC048106 TaxID=3155750 RepID=UPI003453D19D
MTTRPATASGTVPGFGEAFTDHMVVIRYDVHDGWGASEVLPYGPIPMDPAMVGLHYGQNVFEGLKVHRRADGSLAAFRPRDHSLRFQDSARRLMMPELPESMFLQAMEDLVRADAAQVPDTPGLSLYLRPLLIASEACLALRPARTYLFVLMAFVTGGFFGVAPEPVTVAVNRRHIRASPGGTGHIKCGANYAAAYAADAEAAEAGCRQVVWLDSAERRWIEEMGAMNLFFVRGAGPGTQVVTPTLSGTVLPGITRDSLLKLAAGCGFHAVEDRVSVEQWRTESQDGTITETFACGTAAVVTPVGAVRDSEGDWTIGDGSPGPVTTRLHAELTGIQRGLVPDPDGWMYPIC